MIRLRIEGLSKNYGEQSLFSDLSFDFASYERVAVSGPSGVGKTTLLRILAGLEQADSGVVSGNELIEKAFVFQEARLLLGLNAVSNVQLFCPQRSKQEIITGLEALGLEAEDLQKEASQLSGGMQMRVSFLRALLSPARLILMDEPLQGLDLKTLERCWHFARPLLSGRLTILSTHHELTSRRFEAEAGIVMNFDGNCRTWQNSKE